MARQFSPHQLRQRRRAAGLSREQVAVAIGRSYWTVAAYEVGRATPPIPVALKLTAMLGCELSDLLDVEEVLTDAS
jgi:DNA-binding XRE family transcriptional regulator